MQRWVFRILVIAFVWVAVARATEFERFLGTVAGARWPWIVVAAVLQLVYYQVFTAVYQSAFATAGIPMRLRSLLPVVFASLFVNVTAPTGGASGAALFVDDAVRRGHSAARAALGTLLALIADLTAFVVILAPALAVLSVTHTLRPYEVIGVLVLLTILAGLTGLLMLGLWRPAHARRLLSWVQRAAGTVARWARRGPWLPEQWAEDQAGELAAMAETIRTRPWQAGRVLAVALAAHALDLLSLYALFLAFSRPVGIGVLVAGYAMGILFWIVALTPQGIGVVEGVMALVYASLGVPAAQATAVALSFRGLTFWLPLAIGFLVLPRLPSFRWSGTTRQEVWGVRAIVVLLAIMGVVNMLSAVTPALEPRLLVLERWLPVVVRRGARLAAAVAGFGLLTLASSLWRRKRTAWILALTLLVISALTHLMKGLDYEESSLTAALAVWLALMRRHFHARSDPPSVRQGLRAATGALAFTMAYGTAGFFLLDRHFGMHFDTLAAFRQTIAMFTEFADPGPEPLTGFGRYFAGSIYAVAAITMTYALVMLTRPVLLRQPAVAEDRARAAAIVEQFGRSSLARLLLLADKAYYFSPGGSVVGYALRGRVAVALGDPVGPPEDVAAAITAFREYGAHNDWIPAFYQTLPEYLPVYRSEGFQVLCIGHEAIVDLHQFTLSGRGSKELRHAVNRLTRLGHRAVLHEPPLPDEVMGQLRAVSDEWLTMVGGTEKRFSLGWFEDGYIRHSRVMAVHTPEGSVSAFVNLVPEYQLNEITIDLMRRRSTAEPGTMDFLFVSLVEWAKEEGYDSFNLGLSPLAGVGERPGDPAVERALRFVYEHLNRFYRFKGLHAFKQKFAPEWSPRYLIYPGPATLPAVALAIIRADGGADTFWWWEYARYAIKGRATTHRA